MGLSPEATFDCLLMAHRLEREADTFTGPELHLFGYLACVLWLYRHRAVADWGYSFVGTELGAPYSQDIDAAIKALTDSGYFAPVQQRLRTTEASLAFLDDLLRLSLNQERTECIQAACASTAAFSVGMVGSALGEEPELRRARAVPMSRLLLEDVARSQLYSHFDAVRRALGGEVVDLRVPALIWLGALYRSSEPVEVW
jgi:hypothetical protein